METGMKNKFKEIVRREIEREGIYGFMEYLEKDTDFYDAPASTKFHGNFKGGLLEHSVKVYEVLCDLVRLFNLEISGESLALCGLFHDVCKVNFYKRGTSNVKGEDGRWTTKEIWEIADKLPLGHGEKSCIILQSYMSMRVDELLAIRWHMGGYDTAVKGGDWSISKAQENVNLVTLLQVADMVASNILERSVD